MAARLLRIIVWPFVAAGWLLRGVFWVTLAVAFLPLGWLFSKPRRAVAAVGVGLLMMVVLRPAWLPSASAVMGPVTEALRWLSEPTNQSHAGGPPTATSAGDGQAGRGGAAVPGRVRVSTFNVNGYGARPRPTDERRLAQLLRSLDADLIALQEVGDFVALRRLAGLVSGGARQYNWIGSECGGTGDQHLAFLYDSARVQALGAAELPAPARQVAGGPCSGPRPVLVGAFVVADHRVDVVDVHLPAFVRGAPARREKVRDIARWIEVRRREGVREFAVLGDFNAPAPDERYALGAMLDEVGVHVAAGSPCSAYWRPDGAGPFEPGLMDLIAMTESFQWSGARVTGYCAAASCRAFAAPPPADFGDVSDHCPVVLDTK